jgi:hypothetical protein
MPTDNKTDNLDPLKVEQDLYQVTSLIAKKLLQELRTNDSEMTIPQLIQALTAAGRLQMSFQKLHETEADELPGATVRRYAAAFQSPHAGARGTPSSRRAEFDRDDSDGDADSAA